jgi:hypothetical protein
MPRSSHPSLLDYSNYPWRRVQVMKLLIMQLSPTSCHVIPEISTRNPKKKTFHFANHECHMKSTGFEPQVLRCGPSYVSVAGTGILCVTRSRTAAVSHKAVSPSCSYTWLPSSSSNDHLQKSFSSKLLRTGLVTSWTPSVVLNRNPSDGLFRQEPFAELDDQGFGFRVPAR